MKERRLMAVGLMNKSRVKKKRKKLVCFVGQATRGRKVDGDLWEGER
jgi:hypothetical protein